jgi:hypothetical protein
MIHYLYVGHFAHQGDFIKFQKQADGSLRPVVSRPLSIEIIQNVLKQNGLTMSTIPDQWGIWFDDGFIVCDRFTHTRAAIELVRRLAIETGSDVADYSSQSLVSAADISFAWEPRVPSEKGNILNDRDNVDTQDFVKDKVAPAIQGLPLKP